MTIVLFTAVLLSIALFVSSGTVRGRFGRSVASDLGVLVASIDVLAAAVPVLAIRRERVERPRLRAVLAFTAMLDGIWIVFCAWIVVLDLVFRG